MKPMDRVQGNCSAAVSELSPTIPRTLRDAGLRESDAASGCAVDIAGYDALTLRGHRSGNGRDDSPDDVRMCRRTRSRLWTEAARDIA